MLGAGLCASQTSVASPASHPAPSLRLLYRTLHLHHPVHKNYTLHFMTYGVQLSCDHHFHCYSYALGTFPTTQLRWRYRPLSLLARALHALPPPLSNIGTGTPDVPSANLTYLGGGGRTLLSPGTPPVAADSMNFPLPHHRVDDGLPYIRIPVRLPTCHHTCWPVPVSPHTGRLLPPLRGLAAQVHR